MEYISEKELVKKCKKGTVVALVSRDDEVNTNCAVEICKAISATTESEILYFSLKEVEEFRLKHPDLGVDVIDTAAIEVEKLVEIVQKKHSISPISLIVLDYLMLLSSRVDYATRKEEIGSNIRRLKKLSVEQNIPLSKYTSKDVLVIDEMARNGLVPELLDVIVYIQDINGYSIQILKDEK